MIKRNKILSGIIVAATCSNMLGNAAVMAVENNNSTDIMNLEAKDSNDIEEDVDIILNLEDYDDYGVTTGSAVTVTETEKDNNSEEITDEDADNEILQPSDIENENVEIIDEVKEEIHEELTIDKIITEEPVVKTGGVLPTVIEKVSDKSIDEISEFEYDDASVQVFGINENNNYSSTYGYSALSNLENGTKMQNAYLAVLDYLNKVHNGSINIDSTLIYNENESGKLVENYYLQKINLDEYRLTKKEYKEIFTSIRHDHPEFFWLSNVSGYSMYDDVDIVKYVTPIVDSQYKSRELRSKMKAKVESAIEQYMDVIRNCSNDYEIEFALHKKIIEETIYDPNLDKYNENINNHSIVGVLVNNVAVCESYAKTMQLLLNAAGIENIYVVGHGNGGGHAWNQVCIDGEYYNLDVTWDDTNKFIYDGIRYDYFNSKDEYFNKKHVANKPDYSTGTKEYLYPIKECNSDDASYYSNSDITLKLSDLEEYDNENDAIKKYFTDTLKGYLKDDVYEFRFAGETNELATKMRNYFYNKEKLLDIITSDSDLLNIYVDKCGTSVSFVISEVSSGEREIRATCDPLNKITANSITMKDTLTFDTLKYSAYLIPQFNPINSYDKDQIVWNSSDSNVATVVKGTVTPVGEGTAEITASLYGITTSCAVTVKLEPENELQEEIPVTGVEIIPGSATMYGVGTTQQFKAILEPYNATNTNVTWKSGDESILSIDKNGLATANGIGSTYIYCIPDETTMTSFKRYFVTVNPAISSDKSKLQLLYDENKDKLQNNYTYESFNLFKEALNKAAEVLEDSKASQELVDSTYSDLEKAVAELKEKDNSDDNGNDSESGVNTSEKIGYGQANVTNQSEQEMSDAVADIWKDIKITEETTVEDIFNAYAAVLGSDVKIEITKFSNDTSKYTYDYDFMCSNSNGSSYFVTGGGYESESSRLSAISIPIYNAIEKNEEFTENTTKEDIEAIIREIVKKEGFNFEVESFENKDGVIRITCRVDSKNLSQKWSFQKNHKVKLQNYTGMGQASVTNQLLGDDLVGDIQKALNDMDKNEKTTAEDVYNTTAKFLGTDVTIKVSDFYNGSDYYNDNGGYMYSFNVDFSNSIAGRMIGMSGGYRPAAERIESLINTINTKMYFDDYYCSSTTEAQVRILLDSEAKDKGYDYEIISFENDEKEMKLSYSISFNGVSVSSDFVKIHKQEEPGDNDNKDEDELVFEKLDSLRKDINTTITEDNNYNSLTTEAQIRVLLDEKVKKEGYDYEITSFENNAREMNLSYSIIYNHFSLSSDFKKIHTDISEKLESLINTINTKIYFDDYYCSSTTEAQVRILLDSEVKDKGYDYEIISFENDEKEMKLCYSVSFNGVSVSYDFVKIHKEVPELKPEQKPDFPADEDENSGSDTGDNEGNDEIQDPVLPVSKDELKEIYGQYKDLRRGSYTSATWTVFTQALIDADFVINNGDATQEEVDKMYETLKAAYSGLKKQSSSSSSHSSSSSSGSSSSNDNSAEASNNTNITEDKNVTNNELNSSGSVNSTVDTVKSISESIGGEVVSKEKVVTQNGNIVEVTKVMINDKSANIVKAEKSDVVSVKASETDKVYVFVEGLGVYKEIDSELVEGNAVFNAVSGMSYIVSDSTVISNEVSDGWNKVNDSWYVVNENGALATGWYKDNDKWYNLSSDGKMNTGWIKDNDGKWYMLSDSGVMKTGWQYENGTWYHLSDSGSMNTGWIKDANGKWYYLNNNGSMASNQYVDGYWVNSNGEWV